MLSPTPRKTDIYVSSGQVLSGHSFTNTVILVESGGTIAVDNLSGGAQADVADGGSAVSISVYSGGYLAASGGSVLSHDTIYAGGSQTEGPYDDYDGLTAEAVDTLVLSGGTDYVDDYGLGVSATIEAGGLQQVYGRASATLVERGGEMEVSFGSAVDTVVKGGGQMEVQAGASAGGIVRAGGIAVVQADFYDPATLSGLTIASGGTLVLLAGATEQGATIAAGGTLERASVAVFEKLGVDSLLIAAGDTLTQSLGFAMSAYVYSGGVLSAAVVTSGGDAMVYSGGLVIDPVIKSGGVLSFTSDGTAGRLGSAIDPVVFNGGTLAVAEGNVTGATIHSGGFAYIEGDYNGTESGLVDTTVLAGGLVSDSEYGITAQTVLAPGAELNVDVGTASNTQVDSGAALVVFSGTVDDTIVSSGGQITVDGRGNDTFSGGKIEAGGTLTFVSGYAGHAFSNFTLGSGATMVEIAGGTEYGITIDKGATVISGNVGLFQDSPFGSDYLGEDVERLLAVGNTLSAVTVAAGEYLEDAFGGAVSGLTINTLGTAALLGGTINGAVIAGNLTVEAGSANALTIVGGGDAYLDGGTVQNVTIGQGGTEYGNYVPLISTTISMGGLQDTYVSALDTIVLAGGEQYIGGGSARDTTISAGGTAVVAKGMLIDTTIAAGGTIDLNSATFVSGATVSLNNNTDVLTIVEGGSQHDTYTLQLAGSYAGKTFHVASDAQGGTMVTLSAAGAVLRDPALGRELTPGVASGGYAMSAGVKARLAPAGPEHAVPPAAEAGFGHVAPHAL